jgi:hypothetical protein
MSKILGWLIFFGMLMLVISLNAFYKLFLPQAWFRLPPWIRATGTLKVRNYATAGRTIGLRFTGAVFLAVIGWIIFDLLVKHS